MKNIISQAWCSILAVPTNMWMMILVYTLSMIVVYVFGLPFKKTDRRQYVEKNVSHGIVSTLTRVRVYNALYTEANAITLLGAIGLVVMLLMVLTNIHTATLPFIFLSAAVLSDLLDGKACKRHDCHSTIGALLDPLRDRLAILVIITSIVKTVGLGMWLIPAMFILVFELGVAHVAAHSHKRGVVLNSHGPGEKRQVVHLIATWTLLVFFYLLTPPYALSSVTTLATIVMASASLYAMFHYRKLYHEHC